MMIPRAGSEGGRGSKGSRGAEPACASDRPGAAPVGRIAGIWRYPVKSMGGERLEAGDLTPRGLLGDRAWGLVDVETGRVVSAKRPRRWAGILDASAEFLSPPSPAATAPDVRIGLPDGTEGASTDPATLEGHLSRYFGRDVRLRNVPPREASFEYHWPDMEGLVRKGRTYRDEITRTVMPPGTFFDGAALLVLTTASLARLREQVPGAMIEAARFRPNLVIELTGDDAGFPEERWVGRTLRIGRTARIRVTGPCLRCVMVTLAQGDLPEDRRILQTVFRRNAGNVGVNAAIERPGPIRTEDPVWLEGSEGLDV